MTTTYEQLRSGALHGCSARIGRRIIVDRWALDELLTRSDGDA
jgi:hypothetical protein